MRRSINGERTWSDRRATSGRELGARAAEFEALLDRTERVWNQAGRDVAPVHQARTSMRRNMERLIYRTIERIERAPRRHEIIMNEAHRDAARLLGQTAQIFGILD